MFIFEYNTNFILSLHTDTLTLTNKTGEAVYTATIGQTS